MEYLGEIELENNYKRIRDAFSSNCNNYINIMDFEISEDSLWFICFKNDITLLKRIYKKNHQLAKMVSNVLEKKNMKELLHRFSQN